MMPALLAAEDINYLTSTITLREYLPSKVSLNSTLYSFTQLGNVQKTFNRSWNTIAQ